MDIVCLHGMGRTRYSMFQLARHLKRDGHEVHLFGYQRRASLSDAARRLATYLRERGFSEGGSQLGFVGHSAGGVLLRYLAAEMPGFQAGHSVALGSPLAGSTIAGHYSEEWWAKALLGPILHSLHPEEVAQLPPPPCHLGSIAGTAQSVLLPAAVLLRPISKGRPSDATVLVEETRIDGNRDHTEVPVVHTLLPSNKAVHKLVSHFLKHGRFPTSSSR